MEKKIIIELTESEIVQILQVSSFGYLDGDHYKGTFDFNSENENNFLSAYKKIANKIGAKEKP